MKTHTAQSQDGNRRATANGKTVAFLRRDRKTKRKVLNQVWKQSFASFDAAVNAAGIWARGGSLMEAVGAA